MQDWTEQANINDSGSRLVLETNWRDVDGPRCQMIWERQPDGGSTITTCDPNVPVIRLTAEQAATLAYWLRHSDTQR